MLVQGWESFQDGSCWEHNHGRRCFQGGAIAEDAFTRARARAKATTRSRNEDPNLSKSYLEEDEVGAIVFVEELLESLSKSYEEDKAQNLKTKLERLEIEPVDMKWGLQLDSNRIRAKVYGLSQRSKLSKRGFYMHLLIPMLMDMFILIRKYMGRFRGEFRLDFKALQASRSARNMHPWMRHLVGTGWTHRTFLAPFCGLKRGADLITTS